MVIFRKLSKSTEYSLAGLRATWQRELAFRIECLVALLLSPILLIPTSLSITQKSLMFFMLILPLMLELLNSAIEAVCNVVSKEHHPEIKFIKDAASAAVFLANNLLAVIWGINLWSLF